MPRRASCDIVEGSNPLGAAQDRIGAGSMTKIVISYRRRDSEAMTGRIFDRLVAHYGRDAVFRDIDNIPPGIDYRAHITDALAHSDIFLAIVGPNWAARSGRAGHARIDDEDDLVRIEVETALRRGIPVIPVLLGDTRMPTADHVPEGLKNFVFRQAVRVDPGRDFEHHMERLTREIDRILERRLEAVALKPQIEAPRLALPDKPSVAVLPFGNMSGDPEQEFLADGIAEDVITALSRYPSLFVIARNSSFTFAGRTVNVKEIGRELGVRYVLEGSLRRAGDRIRVTAQLVEAEIGNHLWAERYDRDLADIFAVQDEITQAVTIAIAPAIRDAELRRALRKPTGNLDAWTAYQRGLWHHFKSDPDDNSLAQRYFQQAIDLDPTFSGGYLGLARAYIQVATDFETVSRVEAHRSAETLARQAIALDPADAEAHSTLAAARLHARGDYEGAIAAAEQALALSPNLASAYVTLGSALNFSGRPREGLVALERSIRLDPHEPALPGRLNGLALGLYFAHEYEAAVDAAKRAIRANPNFPLPYRWLAAALGQLGSSAEAAEALEKARAISPASFDKYVRRRVPWHRPEDHAHMIEGLRKAGWREE